MASNYCGLDFGTSNSTLGVLKKSQPELICLENNAVTLPSAMFFHFENDQIFFGREAINEYIDGEFGRLMRSLKSVLGTSLMHDATQIKHQQLAFTDIISQFILEMKTRAEQAAQTELSNVVMGRPVNFVDDDPVADKEAQDTLESAARDAGFKDILFQYEPIAAALDYERQVNKEEIALIIDLGGGTSDFSVVRLSPEQAKKADRKDDILSNGGVHIGGTDFDKSLSVKNVMPHFGYRIKFRGDKALEIPVHYHHDLATWHKIHFLYQKKIFKEIKDMLPRVESKQLLQRFVRLIERRECHRLAMRVESSKIALTQHPVSEMDLSFVEEDLAISIQRDNFNNAIITDVEKVIQTIQSVITDAGLNISDITKVFMTGGSTSIPLIRDSIMALLPDTEVINGDMFGSVGMGLTLDAGRKFV